MSKTPVYFYSYYPEGFNGHRVAQLLGGTILGHETREDEQYVQWEGGMVYPGQRIVIHPTKSVRVQAIGYPRKFEVVHAIPVEDDAGVVDLVEDSWGLKEVECYDLDSVDVERAKTDPQLKGLLTLIGKIDNPR